MVSSSRIRIIDPLRWSERLRCLDGPYKGLKFRIPEFSDVVWEFVLENGQAKALQRRDASGEFTFTRK
jgi:hypothetical protein